MDTTIESKRATRTNVFLAVSSGILFGCAFPPSPLGVLACVALVPLLLLIERLGTLRRETLYSYVTFFVGSCIALYWVGGFTHTKDPFLMLGGVFVLLWEPIFFSLIMLSYSLVRKMLGRTAALFSLPALWVSFEWLYALGEFAFPWLTLGNTQTYQLGKIQFAEITGVYGISFWIVIINILFFSLLMCLLEDDRRKSPRRTYGIAALIVVVYVLPDLYAATVDEGRFFAPNGNRLTVGIVQPNLDPWDKWEGSRSIEGRWGVVQKLLAVTGEQKKNGAQMSVWPETSILFDLPKFPEYLTFRRVVDSLGIGIVSGYASYTFYDEGHAPAASSIMRSSKERYDSYNSILFVQPHEDRLQRYAKMRLVPFAERIPYAGTVPFLIEPLRWGVGISNWGIGKDSTVFEDTSARTKFLAIVCYESIFPEFVGSFVNRGAQFLVFITNDSWWGNTSGARQHSQFAVLRSVENRRWSVRCANGGISSFIDPLGRMFDKTQMYTEASIIRTIEPRTEKTFYTRHGDWVARACALIAGIFLCASLFKFFMSRKYS